ncbi:hypothetical protein ALP75_201679 [Pseudomonas syringae pv. actinidiae]|nr:hypothetical protein ALP75_201679 [Pseudomonas syringae pv. actinidiae]
MMRFGFPEGILLMLQMHIHQRTHHPQRRTFRGSTGLTACAKPAVLAGFHLQTVFDIERRLARAIVQMSTEGRQASFLVFRVQP